MDKKRNNKKRYNPSKDFKCERSAKEEKFTKRGKPDWLKGKEEVIVSDYTNDVSFYNESPIMFDATCSLPGTAGQGYLNPAPKTTVTDEDIQFGIPGFITYNFMATPGYANPTGNYINISNNIANNLFTKVRMNKNGTAPYSKSDLVMYIMMMDELYTEWFQLRRILGVLNLAHPVNGYTPNDFCIALGISGAKGDDIAKLTARLNYLGTMINQWPIPTDFKILQRHADMVSALYTDSQDMRAQYFAFNRPGYRKWNDKAESGTVLEYTAYASDNLLDRYGYLEDNLIAFQKSESAALIRADIITAYSNQGSYRLPTVDTNYVVPVVFDSVINMQVTNMDIFTGIEDKSLDISEDVGRNALVFQPRSLTNLGTPLSTNLFFDADLATPEMVAEATRLKFLYDATNENTFGTELVTEARVFTKAGETMGFRFKFQTYWGQNFDTTNGSVTPLSGSYKLGGTNYTYIGTLLAFAVRPHIELLIKLGTAQTPEYHFCGYLNDICMLVPLSFDQLHAINNTCVNSEFGLLSLFNGRTGTQG